MDITAKTTTNFNHNFSGSVPVTYEAFEGNKCIFFIGKCSKFSSVTLNFSEVYPNCFGSLKGCVTDITPSVTDITVCEFFS